MCKKTFFVSVFFLVVIITLIPPIYATGNNFASVMVYGGFENIKESVKDTAQSAYQTAGYAPVTAIENPNSLVILSNLMAEVQFHFTHGALHYIYYPEANYGLIKGDNQVLGDVEFIGTNNIDWSDNLLVTFAACNTAGGDPSLEGTEGYEPYYDLDSLAANIIYNNGKMSVGWTTQIHINGSTKNWLNRYNNRLGMGDTVEEAINYANSFIYASTSIKNVQLFYNSNLGGILPIKKTTTNSLAMPQKMSVRTYNLIGNSNKEVESQLDKILVENYSANLNNYEVKLSNSGITEIDVENDKVESKSNYYVDYIYKIGDFLTDYGYTTIIESNEAIIYDNTKTSKVKQSVNTMKFDENMFRISLEKENEIIEWTLNEINSNDKEIIKNIMYYYDIDYNQRYAIISIDNNGDYMEVSYKF